MKKRYILVECPDKATEEEERTFSYAFGSFFGFLVVSAFAWIGLYYGDVVVIGVAAAFSTFYVVVFLLLMFKNLKPKKYYLEEA